MTKTPKKNPVRSGTKTTGSKIPAARRNAALLAEIAAMRKAQQSLETWFAALQERQHSRSSGLERDEDCVVMLLVNGKGPEADYNRPPHPAGIFQDPLGPEHLNGGARSVFHALKASGFEPVLRWISGPEASKGGSKKKGRYAIYVRE